MELRLVVGLVILMNYCDDLRVENRERLRDWLGIVFCNDDIERWIGIDVGKDNVKCSGKSEVGLVL